MPARIHYVRLSKCTQLSSVHELNHKTASLHVVSECAVQVLQRLNSWPASEGGTSPQTSRGFEQMSDFSVFVRFLLGCIPQRSPLSCPSGCAISDPAVGERGHDAE